MQNGVIAEFEKHHGTIAMFPFRNDIWRDNAVHMQKYMIELINIISHYEPVYLFCKREFLPLLDDKIRDNIFVIPCDYNDIWARDIAPTFIRNGRKIQCVDWQFNAWGGKKEGAYYPWDDDDRFAKRVAEYFKLPCNRNELVLEGGGLISNGQGILFSTKSVVLNRNRNPFKKCDFVREQILKATCSNDLIWIDQGLAFDETNGHIDNLMGFVNSKEICLAWTDDKKNPNYKRVRKAYKLLNSINTIEGEKYKIHLIPLPPLQYMKDEETNGLWRHQNALPRNAGDILPASYLNYYLINGAVLIPSFGCEQDLQVKALFEVIFHERDVIQIYSREPLLGGGGIHCLLHEIPVFV